MISKIVDTTNSQQCWLILQDNNHPELHVQKQYRTKAMLARGKNHGFPKMYK